MIHQIDSHVTSVAHEDISVIHEETSVIHEDISDDTAGCSHTGVDSGCCSGMICGSFCIVMPASSTGIVTSCALLKVTIL